MNGKNFAANISGRKNLQIFSTPVLVILLSMASISWPQTGHGDELQDCLIDALSRAEVRAMVCQKSESCTRIK